MISYRLADFEEDCFWTRSQRCRKISDRTKNAIDGRLRRLAAGALIGINDIVENIESNAKPFWRYIGNCKGHSPKIQSILRNSERVVSSADIASTLNDQFASVFTKEDQFSCPRLARRAPVMKDFTVTEPGV